MDQSNAIAVAGILAAIGYVTYTTARSYNPEPLGGFDLDEAPPRFLNTGGSRTRQPETLEGTDLTPIPWPTHTGGGLLDDVRDLISYLFPATIDDVHAGHIFGNREGHIPDTPENRKLLEDTASDLMNYLGNDQYNNEWYAQILPDGTQAWAQVRNGKIRNGGVNQTPKTFDPRSGLSNPTRPW